MKFQASGPDKIIFHIERRGRILIENGSRVVFDAFAGVEARPASGSSSLARPSPCYGTNAATCRSTQALC